MNESPDLPSTAPDDRDRRVQAYYDGLSDDDWAAEDERAFSDASEESVVFLKVPVRLVPRVRELLNEDLRRRKPA